MLNKIISLPMMLTIYKTELISFLKQKQPQMEEFQANQIQINKAMLLLMPSKERNQIIFLLMKLEPELMLISNL